MENKVLKAKFGSDKTPLYLGELSIPCYVLEDGTRVFSGRGIQNAIGANPNYSGTWLSKFINSKPISTNLPPGFMISYLILLNLKDPPQVVLNQIHTDMK